MTKEPDLKIIKMAVTASIMDEFILTTKESRAEAFPHVWASVYGTDWFTTESSPSRVSDAAALRAFILSVQRCREMAIIVYNYICTHNPDDAGENRVLGGMMDEYIIDHEMRYDQPERDMFMLGVEALNTAHNYCLSGELDKVPAYLLPFIWNEKER